MSSSNAPSLQQRTVEVIKEAHDLLTEQRDALTNAEKKIAATDQDFAAADPLVKSLVDKLSSHRVDGGYLIPPDEKELYLRGMARKEGLASVACELADRLISQATDKTASELGEAATPTDGGYDSDERGIRALLSHRMRF